MLLQSTLKKIGFYSGDIDGIFGNSTHNAVINFQKNFGLVQDGIVGSSTWNALYPYLYGYTSYVVKPNDTLYSIAVKFSTTVNRILMANHNLNPNNLSVGSSIIVPFISIVPTDVNYTYDILQMNIASFSTVYPFIETGSIGNSVLGRKIPYLRIGTGKKEVFYSASIHANEWITTPVIMKFIENYAKAYTDDGYIYGYKARSIYNSVSIYFVPMVNPDGVDLVTGALLEGSDAYTGAQKIADNYPNIAFPSGWKANINGIDLNLQFPANWDEAKEVKFEQGYTSPAPRDYVGSGPLVAPEAIAMYNFTLAHNFRLILAYHTQGRVIYWRYLDYLPPASYYIGEQFSLASGYELEDTPYSSSFAGYKDWFIQNYNLPGYTIECGYGSNPLPISQFNTIYSENEGIFVLGAVLAE